MNDLNLLDQMAAENEQAKKDSLRAVRLVSTVIAQSIVALIAIPTLISMNSSNVIWPLISTVPFIELFYYLSLASALAAPVIVAIFFSLNAFEIHVRIVAMLGAITFCLAFLGFGLMIQDTNAPLDNILGAALPAMPTLLFGLCFPFVLMRYLMGWQIVFKGLHETAERQKITVAGLMIFTAVFAFCIAPLRILEEPARPAYLALVFCGFELAVLVPFVLFVMRTDRILSNLVTFCLLVFFVVLVSLQFYGPESKGLGSFNIALGCTYFFVTIGLGLLACRFAGGKLVVHADLAEEVAG